MQCDAIPQGTTCNFFCTYFDPGLPYMQSATGSPPSVVVQPVLQKDLTCLPPTKNLNSQKKRCASDVSIAHRLYLGGFRAMAKHQTPVELNPE